MTQMNTLETYMRLQFLQAKRWWIGASVARFLIVIINATMLWFDSYTNLLAAIVALMTIAQPLAQWYSDRLKGFANGILRKIEMAKGLGWSIHPREISDIIVTLPDIVKNKANTQTQSLESYFFSQETPSPKQLLQNLEESTWWTKHQARTMAWYTGIFSALVVALSIMGLIFSLQNALAQNTADNIAKMTVSVIALLFTGGYIRLTEEYYRLSTAAERAEDRASSLKKSLSLNESEAVKIVHEYQIARSSSPLLPEWLWKMKRVELNKLWSQRSQQDQ